MTRGKAEAMLVLAMLFWGATFVIVKETIAAVPVYWLLVLRFSLGAVAVWIPLMLFGRGAVRLTRDAVRAGVVLGLPLFLIFALQTLGLLTTTASKSAFITSTSVLWVPVLTVLVLGRRMDRGAVFAGGVGFVGLFLLLMDHGLASFHPERLVVGDFQTLVCALAVAAHLLLTKYYCARHDTWVLTAVQLTVVAVLSLGCSFASGETRSFDYSSGIYGAILFLGLVTTALNMWILTHMQRYTTPQRTAVIFLVEPLFAAAAAWMVLGEVLGWVQWCGALLILGGMLVLECRPARPATPAE